jgi:hypothetical protein
VKEKVVPLARRRAEGRIDLERVNLRRTPHFHIERLARRGRVVVHRMNEQHRRPRSIDGVE